MRLRMKCHCFCRRLVLSHHFGNVIRWYNGNAYEKRHLTSNRSKKPFHFHFNSMPFNLMRTVCLCRCVCGARSLLRFLCAVKQNVLELGAVKLRTKGTIIDSIWKFYFCEGRKTKSPRMKKKIGWWKKRERKKSKHNWFAFLLFPTLSPSLSPLLFHISNKIKSKDEWWAEAFSRFSDSSRAWDFYRVSRR